MSGRQVNNMTAQKYEHVCYKTEQRDEHVLMCRVRDGQLGYSWGCTMEGATIQVKLLDGELDSWERSECIEVS